MAWPRREGGQTLVMIVLMLVVLVGFLALVIDVGHMFVQRRAMQNAADAAALAGVRALALGQSSSAIQAAVREYGVDRNGGEIVSLEIVSPTVTVVVTRTCETYFAAVVGVPTFTVSAAAVGKFGYPRSWQGNLMPFAVAASAVTTPGTLVEIWDDENTPSDPAKGIIADGQRGWLNYNGGAVSDTELVNWVTNGWQGTINVGQYINGTPGTKTAALHAMDAVRTGTTIFAPVYDTTRPGQLGNGQVDYRVAGFAAFYVVQVVDTGNPKFVKGRFQRWLTTADMGGTVDTGVRVIALFR